MTGKRKALFGLSACSFAFIWAFQVIVLAFTVKEWLDKDSMVSNGGTPYFVCFLVAGLTISAVALYSCYLYSTEWSHTKFIQSIKLAFIVSALAAVLCTVWFVILTGLFNVTGLLGILVALSAAIWAVSTCTIALRNSESSS